MPKKQLLVVQAQKNVNLITLKIVTNYVQEINLLSYLIKHC